MDISFDQYVTLLYVTYYSTSAQVQSECQLLNIVCSSFSGLVFTMEVIAVFHRISRKN